VFRIAWFGKKIDQKNSLKFFVFWKKTKRFGEEIDQEKFLTMLSPPIHVRWKISASVDGGPSGGSRVRRPGSEDSIGASGNSSS
jgi:hypothetical protein